MEPKSKLLCTFPALKWELTWKLKPKQEQSTEDIWDAICYCSNTVLGKSGINPYDVKGIGFDATCSLAVLDEQTDQPVSVAWPEFKEKTRNVICMFTK